MFWLFGPEACGIQPTPSALEGEVLTTGPPRKSHHPVFRLNFMSLQSILTTSFWTHLDSAAVT